MGMTFRSGEPKIMILDAAEDFKKRTLSSLPTVLEKLAYICSLATADGAYGHWGMNRTFGEQRAQKAIGDTHHEIAMELTRVPIREVYYEFQEACQRPVGEELLNPESFVLKAPVNDDELLSAHLRLIQDSVESLVLRERTIRRVA